MRIRDLRQPCEEKFGMENTRFLFAGKTLQDSQTIASCNIQNGQVVHIIPILKGGECVPLEIIAAVIDDDDLKFQTLRYDQNQNDHIDPNDILKKFPGLKNYPSFRIFSDGALISNEVLKNGNWKPNFVPSNTSKIPFLTILKNPSTSAPSSSVLVDTISVQTASGLWEFNYGLMKRIGVFEETFQKIKSKVSASGSALMTLIVLAWLEAKNQEEKKKWLLVAKKPKAL